MFETVERGATSRVVEIMLRDPTTGQGAADFNASGFLAYYVRSNSAPVAVALSDGAVGAAFSAGVWASYGVSQRGLYALHVPDAAFAAGADSVTLFITSIFDATLDFSGRFSFVDPPAGAGDGAQTVTVTVDDGAAVLEGASVRLSSGASTFYAVTDVSGVAVFNVDPATFVVAITRAGYYYGGASLVVPASAVAVGYSMTAAAVSAPPSASTSTGVLQVLNEQGAAESGVPVSCAIEAGPGTGGVAYDRRPWVVLSDSAGVVEFAGMIQGARYSVWRGDRREVAAVSVTVPASESFNIADVVGEDE